VAVWATRSLFVQVTVVPTLTIKLAGEKVKLTIETFSSWFCDAEGVAVGEIVVGIGSD